MTCNFGILISDILLRRLSRFVNGVRPSDVVDRVRLWQVGNTHRTVVDDRSILLLRCNNMANISCVLIVFQYYHPVAAKTYNDVFKYAIAMYKNTAGILLRTQLT